MEGAASGRGTILVVEDVEDIRELAAGFLADSGYRVFAVGRGEEALALLRGSETVDLLFTDILLEGGENGLRLAREAIMIRPGLRVVYATGYSHPLLDKEPMVARGELVLKPYNLRALAAKIDWTLRARRFELNRVHRELWRHWREREGDDGSRPEETIAGLDAIRGSLAMAAVTTPLPNLRCTYTFFGETMIRWAARDPTGLFIDEIANGEYREFIMSVYAEVVANRRGVYAASTFRGERPALTERLLLPLPNDGGEVRSVLAAQTFDQVDPESIAFRFLQRAPDRVDIVEPVF